MTISKKTQDNTTVLLIEGRLDTQSAPALCQEIDAIDDTLNLVLDFEKLEYISSYGLREIISAYKKVTGKGGEFSIIHVQKDVMDMFRLTGLNKKLTLSC